jgi:hypothetical protein
MLGFMGSSQDTEAGKAQEGPNFSSVPSRPRAGGVWRFILLLLLVAIACGAIWWIDRGVALNNSHP